MKESKAVPREMTTYIPPCPACGMMFPAFVHLCANAAQEMLQHDCQTAHEEGPPQEPKVRLHNIVTAPDGVISYDHEIINEGRQDAAPVPVPPSPDAPIVWRVEWRRRPHPSLPLVEFTDTMPTASIWRDAKSVIPLCRPPSPDAPDLSLPSAWPGLMPGVDAPQEPRALDADEFDRYVHPLKVTGTHRLVRAPQEPREDAEGLAKQLYDSDRNVSHGDDLRVRAAALIRAQAREIAEAREVIDTLQSTCSLYESRIQKTDANLAAVTAERDRIRRDANEANRILGEQCEKVTTERDALRADADRYRWLRLGWDDQERAAIQYADAYHNLWDLQSPAELDAAIDAAREEK